MKQYGRDLRRDIKEGAGTRMQGMGCFSFITSDAGNKPHVPWTLIKRVLGYAKPHRLRIALTLLSIVGTSLLGLVTPLLFRKLIDDAIPNKNVHLLDLLAI